MPIKSKKTQRKANGQRPLAAARGSAADYEFICRASEKLSMVELAFRLGHTDLHEQHLSDLLKMFAAKGHIGYQHPKPPNRIALP